MLVKAVSGYEYEETIAIYKRSLNLAGNEILVPQGFRKYKKFRPPSDRAIQFVLTKLKPEVYGNMEASISIQLTTDFGELSLEEIEQEIKKLEAM